jgi:hypothetical protein
VPERKHETKENKGRYKEGWFHVTWKIRTGKSLAVDGLGIAFWEAARKNQSSFGRYLGEGIQHKSGSGTVGSVLLVQECGNGSS